MTRRYFLTGCTGFCGRALVRNLIKRDDTESIVLLTRDAQKRYEMYSWDKRITLHEGDVTTCQLPTGEFTDLIHGANEANDLLQPDQMKYYYTIVEGTERVLSWAMQKGIERKLILSSGAATRETVYGRAKRQCERIALHCGGVKIARIYSLIGEEMPLNGQYAVGRFVHQALVDGEVRFYGGKSERTYLHVDECAEWLSAILTRGFTDCAYEVAGDKAFTIYFLAYLVADVFGVKCKQIDGPERKDLYLPDLTLSHDLGLKQHIGLRESLVKVRNALTDVRNPNLEASKVS